MSTSLNLFGTITQDQPPNTDKQSAETATVSGLPGIAKHRSRALNQPTLGKPSQENTTATASTTSTKTNLKKRKKVVTRKILGKNLDPQDIDLQVLGAHSKLVVVGGSDKKMKGIHRCLLCGLFSTAAAVNMYGHILMHLSGALSCNQCEYHAKNKTALDEHVASSHRKEFLYTCLACGKGFYQKKRLLLHEANAHEKYPHNGVQQKKPCSHCQESFPNGTRLKKHIQKKHNSDSLFTCGTCSRTFLYKTWFDKHVDGCSASEVMKNVCCNICNSKFADSHRLNLHKRRVHNKEKTQCCSFCDFRAFSATSIKLHERTHTGVHPFKCQLCNFTAAKKFQLTSHMRTHNQEKSFCCDQCPFAGRWKVQLRNHLAAHLSPTSVTCPFCKIVLPHRRSLVHHGRMHKELESSVYDAAINRHAQVSQCPVPEPLDKTVNLNVQNSNPSTIIVAARPSL